MKFRIKTKGFMEDQMEDYIANEEDKELARVAFRKAGRALKRRYQLITLLILGIGSPFVLFAPLPFFIIMAVIWGTIAAISIPAFFKMDRIFLEEYHKQIDKLRLKMSMKVVEMRKEPRWIELLMPNLRPDKKRIDELEKLRSALKIPHEALAMRIIGSPITTRRIQRITLENLRIDNPEASEKELLRMLLVSRYRTPPLIEMTEEEIDQAMKSINSFDELCDFIIKLEEEEEEPPLLDPFGIGKQIDEILAQEVVEKKGDRDGD